MGAKIDVSNLVVSDGETSCPFRLDLDSGSARVELHGGAYEVGPLSWRAKMRLARFAHMDQAFVQARFLEACIRNPKILPSDKRDEALLLALANWINVSSENMESLPLDQSRLAAVTVDVCRALRIGPMAFAELPAPELEMLWLSLDGQSPENETTANAVSTSPLLNSVRAPEPTFDTRIIIVPDQVESTETPQSDLTEEMSPAGDVESQQAVSDDDEFSATADRVANESVVPARERVTPDRYAAARFRVSVDKAIGKPPVKTATTTMRLPIKRSRYGQLSVEPVGASTSVPPSAPARSADPAERSTTSAVAPLVEIPPVSISTSIAPTRIPVIAPVGGSNATQLPCEEESASAPQTENREWMFEEFCERLAEAAADVGILEEV